MDNRFKLIAETSDTRLFLDDEILLEKIGIYGNWKYVHKVNGELTYEHLPKFNNKYLNIFIDDIKEQLKNGIDRNDLIMNIPKKVKTIKCGTKTIQV